MPGSVPALSPVARSPCIAASEVASRALARAMRSASPMIADAQAAHAKRAVLADDSFDSLYSALIQSVSRTHWTPVTVARRTAELFRDAGARRVLDVGSGAGKFVLTAANAAPDVFFVGVEQRHHLIVAARRARRVLRISNARFVHGDVTRTSWNGFDGIYFFNPFGENLLADHEWIDDSVELSRARYREDVLRSEHGLRAARLGTVVVTFNGCGGKIPSSYELAHTERMSGASLRLWIKKSEG